MILLPPTKHLFDQLKDLLSQLSDEEYTQPSSVLSDATIGQHTRHIIELFQELIKGYSLGTIDYEMRIRDYQIESNKLFAVAKLEEILAEISKEDKPLMLHTDYGSGSSSLIQTNYWRELIYNIEHTVHHLALIRVGVADVSELKLSETFGVAASTIKYRKSKCAQ
jgi:hypothetical protein